MLLRCDPPGHAETAALQLQCEGLMGSKFARLIICCLFAAVMCMSAAFAQTVTGSVTGEVTDPSGALVPGAHVTAENVATGVRTQGDTNAAGVYSIRFLPIGQYHLVIVATGFGTLTSPNFALEINQTVKLNE